MADNLQIKDATGTTKTVRTSDQSGSDLHIPHHRIGEGVTLTGPAAQSVVNTDLLTGTVNGWFDASLFMSGAVQIVASAGISAGAITFEQTNDASATTGVALAVDELGVINANPQVAAITIAANTRRIFSFSVVCKYIRVRISTGFTGGTVQAIGFFSQQPFANPTLNVQQATAGNLAVTATISGNPAVVGPGASGAAKSGNPVRVAASDGTNTRDLLSDSTGRLLIVGGAADGSPVSGNPVLIAGQDGTNAQSLLTDNTGRLLIAQPSAADLNATVTGAVSITGTPTVSVTGAVAVTDGGGSVTVDGAVSVSNLPATQDVNLTQFGGAAISNANPLPVEPAPTTNCVTAVGASAAALTATLPAAGAGLFHYITKIELVLFVTAARTASATPVTVTSTNLPGSFAETMRADNMALGQIERIIHDFTMPLKSSAANTATTIVCPATTGVLWRVNVFYFTGP